jgi:S1-C subfamily serine protease
MQLFEGEHSMKDRAARALNAVALALAALLAMPHGATAESLSEAFERVAASVVVVHTTGWDVADTGSQRTVSVSGFGSGVLISADGRVLTAAHWVHAASDISVEFPDGIRMRAHVIASEPDADISLLQLERVPVGTAVAKLADSDRARIGDRVFVVGTPYGISHTLTVGHLGGRHKPGRVWDRFTLAEFFQADAAINRGNSGGPMFNMAGEVLGIVSHIISKSGGFEGLGFVVTSNAARKLLLERRSPWWGFEGVLLTGDLLRVFNLKESAGERLTLTILRRGEIVELSMSVPREEVAGVKSTVMRSLAALLVLFVASPASGQDGRAVLQAALSTRFQPGKRGGMVTRTGRILILSVDGIPARPFRVFQANPASPPVHVMDFAEMRIGRDGRIVAEPAPIRPARGSRLVVLDVKVEASRVHLLTHTAAPVRVTAGGGPVYGCTAFVFELESDVIRAGRVEPIVERIERWLDWTAEERLCAPGDTQLCLEP